MHAIPLKGRTPARGMQAGADVMINLAKALLAGRLTKDPEVRYTAKGTAVANMRVAVNYRVKDKKAEASFFDVVAFGKLAEQCGEYLAKGRTVLVEGRMRQRSWEPDEGGRRSRLEILAATVEFLDPPPEGARKSPAKPAKTAGEEDAGSAADFPAEDEEPPF